jgi:hypothetical protein
MTINLSPLSFDLDRLVSEGFTPEEAVLYLFATRPWLFDGVQ